MSTEQGGENYPVHMDVPPKQPDELDRILNRLLIPVDKILLHEPGKLTQPEAKQRLQRFICKAKIEALRQVKFREKSIDAWQECIEDQLYYLRRELEELQDNQPKAGV